MSFAALLGGLALANAGLGVVHGFAAPIGGMFPAPHGAVCAAILPAGVRANLHALADTTRYETIAEILTGHRSGDALVEYLQRLTAELGIPGLRAYGVSEEHTEELADKAAQASSMKANPVALPPETLREIVSAAL